MSASRKLTLSATPQRVHPRRDAPHVAEDPRIRASRAPCANRQSLSGMSIHSQSEPRLISDKEHRHSFVRKNAVFAVYSIYQDHEHLIPDAPELLDAFLAAVRACQTHSVLTWSGVGFYLQTQCLRNVVQHCSADCCSLHPRHGRPAGWYGRAYANGSDRVGSQGSQE